MQKALRAVLAPLVPSMQHQQQQVEKDSEQQLIQKINGFQASKKSYSENQASLSTNQLCEKSFKSSKTLINLTESLKKECQSKIQGKREYKFSISAELQLIQQASFEISQKLQTVQVPNQEGFFFQDGSTYFNITYQVLYKACHDLQVEKDAISQQKSLHVRQLQSLQIVTQETLKLLTDFLLVDSSEEIELQKFQNATGLMCYNNDVSFLGHNKQHSNNQGNFNNSAACTPFSYSNMQCTSHRKTQQGKISQRQLKKQNNEQKEVEANKSDVHRKVNQWLEQTDPEDLLLSSRGDKIMSNMNSQQNQRQGKNRVSKSKLNKIGALLESLNDDDVVEGMMQLCQKVRKGDLNFESMQESNLFNSIDIQFMNGSEQVMRWIYQLITIIVSTNINLGERIIMEFNQHLSRNQLDIQEDIYEAPQFNDLKSQALNSNVDKLPNFLRLNVLQQNIFKIQLKSIPEIKQQALLTLGLLAVSNIDLQRHFIDNKALNFIANFFMDENTQVRVAALVATGQLQQGNIRALQELQSKCIPDLIHSFIDDQDEDCGVRKWAIWCIGCFAFTQVQCQQRVLEINTKKLLGKFNVQEVSSQEERELMDMAIKCILDINHESQMIQSSKLAKTLSQKQK